jgi:transcriptional regulator with XRE-family HTH domain
MDDQHLGRVVRALRRRRGWRQADLAAAAECSQNMISLVERGHISRCSLRLLRRVVGAVDASVTLDLRWRGAALDRLLDEDHAAIAARVATRLRALGWLVEIEVSYSEFGERGSYDLMAFHPRTGALLTVEVKTDLPSAEATLRKLDEKHRLAPKIARERFGWTAASVSRLLVMPATRTLRRRIEAHSALFEQALPLRTSATKRWLVKPDRAVGGIWFVPDIDGQSGIRRRLSPTRVRVPRRGQRNRAVAA